MAMLDGSAAVGSGPGPGNNPPNSGTFKSQRSPMDQLADVRDSIMALVGGGKTKIDDDETRGHWANLVDKLGPQKAQSLMTHIILQNQRPEFQGLKPQDRINAFYQINSSNPDVQPILEQTKSFGSGPNLDSSFNISNIKLRVPKKK
jgi:hypothetical protein